jgi:hypothetical protein
MPKNTILNVCLLKPNVMTAEVNENCVINKIILL